MAWDWEKLQQQKRSTGGGGTPPQVNEVINRLKGAGNKLPGAWALVLIAVLIYLGYSMVYTVGANERGVVQRFGRHVRTTMPGLHVKLPAGIEKVTKVKVDYVYKEEFGFRTLQPGVRTRYAGGSSYLDESLMLTGDLNVAVVPWIVQYRIEDPVKYLFKVRNVRGTLRDLAQSTMRLVVGDHSIDEVINKRMEIASEDQTLLQKALDKADTGIRVTTVEMKGTTVPEPVQPSWNEVNQAIQEKEQTIYQAQQEYNKVIPLAQGQAEKTIKSAEGYAIDRVNRAKGDAARFVSQYEAYAKAKDVTKRRLYLEAIREIFPKLGHKYIVDAEEKNLLPLLNLTQPKGGEK